MVHRPGGGSDIFSRVHLAGGEPAGDHHHPGQLRRGFRRRRGGAGGRRIRRTQRSHRLLRRGSRERGAHRIPVRARRPAGCPGGVHARRAALQRRPRGGSEGIRGTVAVLPRSVPRRRRDGRLRDDHPPGSRAATADRHPAGQRVHQAAGPPPLPRIRRRSGPGGIRSRSRRRSAPRPRDHRSLHGLHLGSGDNHPVLPGHPLHGRRSRHACHPPGGCRPGSRGVTAGPRRIDAGQRPPR